MYGESYAVLVAFMKLSHQAHKKLEKIGEAPGMPLYVVKYFTRRRLAPTYKEMQALTAIKGVTLCRSNIVEPNEPLLHVL